MDYRKTAQEIYAVSYTHLDVYKRQALGKSGPKARTRVVADGQQVEIPVLRYDRTVGTRDVYKRQGSTCGLHWKLSCLSAGGVSGIPSVAVKCVDIRRNTSSEGGLLDGN